MATRWAVASGNWSSNATWNGGASIPSAGDTVYANGQNVTINQNVNIGGANNASVNAGSFIIGSRYVITFLGSTNFTSIGASSNTVGVVFVATGVGTGTGVALEQGSINTSAIASIPIAAGGSFTLASTYTLTADIYAGTTAGLIFSANSPAVASVVGSVTSSNNAGSHGISITGTGTLNVTGYVRGTGGGAGAVGINNASSGTLNLTGNASGGTSTNTYGVANASTGVVIMVGNAFAVASTNSSASTTNLSTGSFTITGNLIAGNNNSPAGSNQGAGTFTVIGNVTASTSSGGFTSQNNTATNRVSGSSFDSANGFTAVNCQRLFLNTSVTNGEIRRSLNGSSTFQSFYTADYSGFGQPAIANVRSGVTYAAGALTGTAAIPAAGSVALGVPVDATTGTAVLTAANVQTALTSQGLTTARATNLDNLDATITSRSTLTKSDVQGAVIPIL
jgi:hypothetical protein